MKVHHLLFIAWFLVFAFWLWGQFSRANKDYDEANRDKSDESAS